MRFSSLAKKGLAVAMAAAVVTAAGAPAAKAASAKIPVSMYFFTTNSEWLGTPDGASGSQTVKKQVTFKSGKKVKVTLTVKKGKKDVKGAGVFCVDTTGILKKFKKVKYSGISVKCDGKKVSGIKYKQGYFEKKEKTNSWRLSFFNQYGSQGDTTGSNGTSGKYAFKKNLSVTFSIVAK